MLFPPAFFCERTGTPTAQQLYSCSSHLHRPPGSVSAVFERRRRLPLCHPIDSRRNTRVSSDRSVTSPNLGWGHHHRRGDLNGVSSHHIPHTNTRPYKYHVLGSSRPWWWAVTTVTTGSCSKSISFFFSSERLRYLGEFHYTTHRGCFMKTATHDTNKHQL